MGHAIRDRIAMELTRLGEQKRRYLVAMEVAENSVTLRKRIRAVQRLDDEIAARKEVLRSLPAAPPDPSFRPYAEVEPSSHVIDEIELDPDEVVLLPDDGSRTTIYLSTGS